MVAVGDGAAATGRLLDAEPACALPRSPPSGPVGPDEFRVMALEPQVAQTTVSPLAVNIAIILICLRRTPELVVIVSGATVV